ncbi:hypothetical protein A4G19_02545 [Pasteurellaceae bacterium Macca]|nr:hypothetical protein [Pasteurellaceae bacterium Macca]
MTIIQEGNLTFTFNNNANVKKYDDLSFYRNQLTTAFTGMKAVDIISIENNINWLIEVKDYSIHQRTKLADLSEEVALKIRDTLAGIVSMNCNTSDSNEKQFAHQFLRNKKIKIVLHLELPNKYSRLYPNILNPVDIQQKLKSLVKSIDAHPRVVNKNKLHPSMSWTVV